jgi:hypothetical protein
MAVSLPTEVARHLRFVRFASWIMHRRLHQTRNALNGSAGGVAKVAARLIGPAPYDIVMRIVQSVQ